MIWILFMTWTAHPVYTVRFETEAQCRAALVKEDAKWRDNFVAACLPKRASGAATESQK